MRVAIVGSRNYPCTFEVVKYVMRLPTNTTVISGGARGVDSIAESIARILGLQTLIFLPDWEKHGKKAGFLRNIEIVKNSDRLVAFWDGESKGTLHSINLAKQSGIPVTIFDKEGNQTDGN